MRRCGGSRRLSSLKEVPCSPCSIMGETNASFLRLKNVVLGYTLPKSVLSKVGIQNLRLYVQAENLLTITGYSGLDPEYTNADMGKESGGDLQRGVDMGGWPSTMRFLFGVNFAF